MKTLIALIAVLFGSIFAEGFNWFEGIIASFLFVVAVLQDLHKIGQIAAKKSIEQIKNELVEYSNEDIQNDLKEMQND
jgi:hypothetical protein